MNIRTTMIDGEPWFVAADACRALGLDVTAGTTQHVRRLPPAYLQTVTKQQTGTLILDQGFWAKVPNGRIVLISEPGLYALVQRSDKPEALAFQRWINEEVLPSIRKTGSYSLADHGREAMPLPMDIAEAMAAPGAAQGKRSVVLPRLGGALSADHL